MSLAHGLILIVAVTGLNLVVIPSSLILIERLRPVIKPPVGDVVFNFSYAVLLHSFLGGFAAVAVAALAGEAVNKAGGGFFTLPASGRGVTGAIVAYTVAMDFGEYIFHRAQHSIPLLWSMHSFHHSDSALNVSTTERHYWLEQTLKTVSVYPMVGLLFKANPAVIFAYSLISGAHYFFHMNLRFGFGRHAYILNSPQYHRIHHSRMREHFDTNFAALFPIFDVIFGSYYVARADEYPATGITDRDPPSSMFEAFIWPLRDAWRPADVPLAQPHVLAPEACPIIDATELPPRRYAR
jgi:sterol desaturase/sphingolipid hydroxylase (fatty acid hydroxylase superfamily)